MVVECDADEAIGVALACDLPLRVEQSVFEKAAVVVSRSSDTSVNSTNMKEVGGHRCGQKWNPKESKLINTEKMIRT